MCDRQGAKFTMPVLGLLALLAGCSTIINGRSQWVVIKTPGLEKATCVVSEESHPDSSIVSPARLKVVRSRGNLDVVCQAPNGETRSGTFASKVFKSVVCSASLGYAVDGLTGAMWTYPSVLNLPLLSASGPVPDRKDLPE
jgi:hypothetical protein